MLPRLRDASATHSARTVALRTLFRVLDVRARFWGVLVCAGRATCPHLVRSPLFVTIQRHLKTE
eukprot:6862290-Prymnesium_polylepis.1